MTYQLGADFAAFQKRGKGPAWLLFPVKASRGLGGLDLLLSNVFVNVIILLWTHMFGRLFFLVLWKEPNAQFLLS